MPLTRSFKRPAGWLAWAYLLFTIWQNLDFLYSKRGFLGTILGVLASPWVQVPLVVLALAVIAVTSRPPKQLAALREEGQGLLNEPVTEQQFPHWWETVDRWTDTAAWTLRNRFGDEAEREFRNPGPFTSQTYPGSINADHANLRSALGHRLDLFDQVVARRTRFYRVRRLF